MATSAIARKTLSLRVTQSLKSKYLVLVNSNPKAVVNQRNFALTTTPPTRGMITKIFEVEKTHQTEESVKLVEIPFAHWEATALWREEAKSLTQAMVTDDIPADAYFPEDINEATRKQVQGLFEEMIDDDLLDPRLCWTISENYN